MLQATTDGIGTCEALLRGAAQALRFAVRAFAVLPSFVLLVAERLVELSLRLDAGAVCKQAPTLWCPASQSM